jgi:hypothetical protein
MAAPTTAELVADVQAGAGDIDATTALRYLNKRQRSMCARSGWFRKTVSIATTVVDRTDYDVSDDIDLLYTVTVDGVPYTKRSHGDIDRLRVGWSSLVGPGGLFAVSDASDGDTQLRLYPAPSEAGLAIEAWASVAPPAMVSGGQAPVVPDDFTDALVEGAIATHLARADENYGSADRNEARFDNACEELRRRAKRRFRPGGVAQARVLGVNA